MQGDLATGEPTRYFVPPYVGTRGWLGVYLDVDVDWVGVEDLVEDAYRMVAPKKLIAALGQCRSKSTDE